MGCNGPRLTWTNGRSGWANTMIRLDRAFYNPSWQTLFPEATVHNLPRIYSDHCPILINTRGIHNFTPINRPFRFEAVWTTHPDFANFVKDNWPSHSSPLTEKLDMLASKMLAWNKNIFGNIFRRKRLLLARIEGIQRSQSLSYTHSLFLLERELISQYQDTLKQEELLWYQKSREKWITQGDKITKYFHLSTLIRRKRNRINILKDADGAWVEDTLDLKNLVNNYFIDLFSPSPMGSTSEWDNLPHPTITSRDNENLIRIPSVEDIWLAVKGINAFKAPGPDGFQSLFFHTYWDIICNSVCDLILDCFSTGRIPPTINKTLIALIPKVDNPESIKQFRPIGLCNVSYKIITKIIVGRLRPLLDHLISPCQASFVPGRQTTDNIIISQEIIHTLKHKTGVEGGMIVKIDFEKAYDKISWDFLHETLLYFKFDDNWITLVMNCVSSSSFNVLWNGQQLPSFKPGRGLRQGDPLSPYLFLYGMERLSILINFEVVKKRWVGIKASRNGSAVSHLFFADDILLFTSTKDACCDSIMNTLDIFCKASGQTINFHKSRIFVSPNVNRSRANGISLKCGIPLTSDLGSYLGVPLLHTRTASRHYFYIIERMQKKLAGWKAVSLSFMGRTTLVQAVTSTIPSYTMQTSAIPLSICDKIDKINRNFIWGDTDAKRKIHLVNWETVCKRKKDGGLGIRKARYNNLAFLNKLGWRIHNERNPLWIQVIKGKYLKNHRFLNWTSRTSTSHVWKSIIKGRDIISKGLKWKIGNGNGISMWQDWWCGNNPIADDYPNIGNPPDKVADFLNTNKDWIVNNFPLQLSVQTIDNICSTMVPKFASIEDYPTWTHTGSGKFSVKSAYNYVSGNFNSMHNWTWLWKLHIPQKLKGFAWIFLHGKILTNVQRTVRGIASDNLCSRCDYDGEDLFHLFFECPSSKDIWANFPFMQVQGINRGNWKDCCIKTLQCDKIVNWNLAENVLFIVILWHIWLCRNRKAFDNVDTSHDITSFNILNYTTDIIKAFGSPERTTNRDIRLVSWNFPGRGRLRLNTDGSSRGNPGEAGFGGVFRDERGRWTTGFYGKLQSCTSLEAELWGIHRGLKMVIDQVIAGADIHTDSQVAVDMVKNGPPPNSTHKNLVEECRVMLEQSGSSIGHIFREGNKVADRLARMGASQDIHFVTLANPPEEIRDLLAADAAGVVSIRL